MNAYCERIICLSDPGQAPGWWLAYQDVETPTLFAPDGRIREFPLDKTRVAVQEAVAAGYRPHLFVPRASDWPAVYDALGPYRDFSRLWVCGRDDRMMAELLQRPSAEIREAEGSDAYLVVPDPEYGKALDCVLETRLADFHPDPGATQAALDWTQTPWRTAAVCVSRLNPFRVLEIELDRVEGELTLRQSYVTADPAAPPEPCERAILLPDDDRLQFDRGICCLDRTQDLQVKTVCHWLGVRPLIMLSEPPTGPLAAWCRSLIDSRDRLLSNELDRRRQKGSFLLWMGAWAARYFGSAPLPTLSSSVRPIQWAARALEEVVREFELRTPLRAAAMPLPTMGAGAMRRSASNQTLEEQLAEVAQAYGLDGAESRAS